MNLSRVCPKCNAAIGARCTRAVADGSKFIEAVHPERLAEPMSVAGLEKLARIWDYLKETDAPEEALTVVRVLLLEKL